VISIRQILGVDGVVSSNFALSKPMSDGAAVAMYLLFNANGSTNEVTVTLSINDCTNHKLIWNYNHVYSGGLGSSPQSLVSGLMRNASRKMPYTIRYRYSFIMIAFWIWFPNKTI